MACEATSRGCRHDHPRRSSSERMAPLSCAAVYGLARKATLRTLLEFVDAPPDTGREQDRKPWHTPPRLQGKGRTIKPPGHHAVSKQQGYVGPLFQLAHRCIAILGRCDLATHLHEHRRRQLPDLRLILHKQNPATAQHVASLRSFLVLHRLADRRRGSRQVKAHSSSAADSAVARQRDETFATGLAPRAQAPRPAPRLQTSRF